MSEWTEEDYEAAEIAYMREKFARGGLPTNGAIRAALDAVAYRLAPSAREVLPAQLTLDQAQALAVEYGQRFKPNYGYSAWDMQAAWNSVFAARPTASEAQEPAGCPVHGDREHGREAEELRSSIETYQESLRHRYGEIDTFDVIDALQVILDEVDARDSLAYLERQDEAQEPAERGHYCDVDQCKAPVVPCVHDQRAQEPAQPVYVNASPADALRPDDRHGMVEQPAGAADVLTRDERHTVRMATINLASREGAWAQAPALLAVIDRLASELAKERERAEATGSQRVAAVQHIRKVAAQLAAERAAVREVVAEMNTCGGGGAGVRFVLGWARRIEAAIGGGK